MKMHTLTFPYVLQGSTLAFKDIGLSVAGKLMAYFINKRKSQLSILVGTSGDTGSAAMMSVAGERGISIVVLYPKGRISQVQELQMSTAAAAYENIRFV